MTVDQSNQSLHEESTEGQNLQQNLREKLQHNLETQYEAKLKENGTIPTEAIEALVGLLSAGDPTSTDVLEALSKSDASSKGGEDHE